MEVADRSALWEVPVVVFLVWTLVLIVSTLIVLSCLRRETRRFRKRLSRGSSVEAVPGIQELDSLTGQYVAERLGKGVLDRLAAAFSPGQGGHTEEHLRERILTWFRARVSELRARGVPEKQIRRTLLAAVRTGLARHPLDLRGSRRALEAAQLLLELERGRPAASGLSVTLPRPDRGKDAPGPGCPTLPCAWLAAGALRCLSALGSHHNAVTLFTITLSVLVWLNDCLTDVVFIDALWKFNPDLMFPTNSSGSQEPTYLSSQTLTTDLYAPLLLLALLAALLCCLLACSCSRLHTRYSIARQLSCPELETAKDGEKPDPTDVLARYDFHLSQAVTASLPQFVLQFSAYMLILYLLETLKGRGVDTATRERAEEKIAGFTFSSLWFSGLGSFLSLVVAQYTAFKIQHEHDMTLAQRIVYFLACAFNTIAMMTTCLVFVLVILLPCSAYVGRYHLMVLVILVMSVLAVATLLSLTLAAFGLDASSLRADRVVTRLRAPSLLTAFIRFSQTAGGQWSSLLGAVTLLGNVLSLSTINLFLPPSQLLVHPFTRFYCTSPRSPALHYAIAKQLTIYNLLHVISSIVLCIDINSFGFNYSLTPATKNLLICSNIFGVPCIFLSLFILFKFYSSHDLWSSHGVHLVYLQDLPTVLSPEVERDPEAWGGDQTGVTVLQPEETIAGQDAEDGEGSEPEANSEVVEAEAPQAESTTLAPGEEGDDSATPLNAEQDDSAEADQEQKQVAKTAKSKSAATLQRTGAAVQRRLRRSCCTLVTDVAEVEVGGGRWVDISD